MLALRRQSPLFDLFSFPTSYWPKEAVVTSSIHRSESDEGFKFEFDMPGLEKEDISVILNQRQLSVSGSREDNGTSARSYRFRAVLPKSADAESITTTYKNGVLVVSASKAPEHTPRSIPVQVSS